MPFLVLVMLLSIYSVEAHAEAWLSNRYAQNCSACHSPGRQNLPAKERRCTLSCQGCHVNPSGGGLRSEYGVWNQQRWLRSFTVDWFDNKKMPAPFKSQRYAQAAPVKPKKKENKNNPEPLKETPENGHPLVVTRDLDYNEKDYDRSDKQEDITIKSREDFLERLTQDDPYRIERRQSLFAGGDFRLLRFSQTVTDANNLKSSDSYLMPMSMDIGVRAKPLKMQNVQLVFEHRYYNYPGTMDNNRTEPEWITSSDGSGTRSTYLLINDLPYASYIQYGVYRPLFGINSPDHTTLSQSMMYTRDTSEGVTNIGMDSALYINNALTIGASPNVPFFNLHFIKPNPNSNFPQDEGMAVNLGGRFVSYSFSTMLSYWSTKTKIGTAEIGKKMLGLNFGGMLEKLVFNADFTQIEKETLGGGLDRGQVNTLELKYRVWREIYLMLNHAQSNTTRTLKNGSARETMMGVKSILTPGTEVELLSVMREDSSATAGNTSRNQFQAMVHLFF